MVQLNDVCRHAGSLFVHTLHYHQSKYQSRLASNSIPTLRGQKGRLSLFPFSLSTQHRNVCVSQPMLTLFVDFCVGVDGTKELYPGAESQLHSDRDSVVCLELLHLLLFLFCSFSLSLSLSMGLRVSKRVCWKRKEKKEHRESTYFCAQKSNFLRHGLVVISHFSPIGHKVNFANNPHEDREKWTRLGPRIYGNMHEYEDNDNVFCFHLGATSGLLTLCSMNISFGNEIHTWGLLQHWFYGRNMPSPTMLWAEKILGCDWDLLNLDIIKRARGGLCQFVAQKSTTV